MADKEATVFVVDVCRSMGKSHQDREVNDLEYSLQYIWDKIAGIVQTGRKTLQCGVIAVGSDTTKHHMAHEEGYSHIEIVRAIGQLLLSDLQRLPEQLKISNTSESRRDVLSAIILGVDMIITHCKQLKYKKRLVVCTNGLGLLDPDELQEVAHQIKENDIQLVILGVDFDDPEYGFKEKDKPAEKKKNEAALRKLADDSGGMFGTMQEAVEGMARPEIKVTRPVPTYRGTLRLGDPENYDTALTIDVERYFKVSVRRAPTASSFAVKQDTDEPGLTSVTQAFRYTVKDESQSGGKPVERDELAKGYQYGRTAVHISQADENITKLETYSSYDILGFIPAENVERYAIIDNSNVLVGQKGNDKATIALSSMIHALYELGSVAVARFVKKDMSEPTITLLSPLVEPDFECLIENVLPFAEDLRTYCFPPLDKILTVSGRALTEHRNLPSDELIQSMSDFVDSMSLVENDEELFPMEDTFSPVLHTIEGAVKFRAVHPDKALPPKPELFATYARQPEHLQEASRPALERLIDASKVHKVEAKAKGRRKYRNAEKPLSNLDVGALLKTQDRPKDISPDNAVPEFKQWLDQTTDLPQVKEATRQMGAIVQKLITDSYGDQNYARAIEMLGTVREAIKELEMADIWNDLLKEIKEKVKKGQLGGERREWWYQLRGHKLGLIDTDEQQYGGVSPETAKEFWSLKS